MQIQTFFAIKKDYLVTLPTDTLYTNYEKTLCYPII